VCVRSSLVGRAGDDGRGLASFADLVGGIVDGESILVVAVADVTTVVLLIRAAVFNTLTVVAWSVIVHTIRSTGRHTHHGRIHLVQRTLGCRAWKYR
jgi:hypothetical protein